MLRKPPEEGLIWEWRAFGAIGESLASKVRSYPYRLGIAGLDEHDLYLISPTSEQNIKLRKVADDWLLKIKLLLTKTPRSIERYQESADLMFRFPVSRALLERTAALLETRLPEAPEVPSDVGAEEFVRLLARSSPRVSTVEVVKRRSQFEAEGGWVELAGAEFPALAVQTLSVQSPVLAAVERLLDELAPGAELEVMNYVEACRRWRYHDQV